MAKDHSQERKTPEAGAIPASGPVPQLGISIVVLGSAEALPLLTKVWEQKAVGAIIIPVEIGEGPFSEGIDRVIANDDIPTRSSSSRRTASRRTASISPTSRLIASAA